MATTGSMPVDAAAVQADADKVAAGTRAQELVEDAEKIADALASLGERVRTISKRFRHFDPSTGTAVDVVANIQSDVMQGTGALGVLLWTLTTDAGAYDRDRQAARISAARNREGRPVS